MNTIGLFPADTLSAQVIDIVVFNISKKTKVWKVACWKSSDSSEIRRSAAKGARCGAAQLMFFVCCTQFLYGLRWQRAHQNHTEASAAIRFPGGLT